MRSFALLSLIAASTVLTAQTTSAGPAVLVAPPASQGCPVSFSAQHADQGATVKVSPQSSTRGQGYRLSFRPTDRRGIAQVRLTLHGIAGYEMMPAGKSNGTERPAGKKTGDASESFTVAPSSEARDLFHSTIYTEKLTGVQWVEVNEITYADGATWHESAVATCRVAPNGFMLVASGK